MSTTKDFVDQHEYQRVERSNSITLWYGILCFLLIVFPPANKSLRFVMSMSGVTAGSDTQTDLLESIGLSPDYNRPIGEGELIAGFKVTSGYGDRVHPVSGERKFHEGVDLGMPVGTPVYTVGDRESTDTVKCWTDPQGYGNVADVTASAFPNFTLRYGHLSFCNSGTYKGGEIFGKSGNTGSSTAPHLHVEEIEGDANKHPRNGLIWWALLGYKPDAPLGRGIK